MRRPSCRARPTSAAAPTTCTGRSSPPSRSPTHRVETHGLRAQGERRGRGEARGPRLKKWYSRPPRIVSPGGGSMAIDIGKIRNVGVVGHGGVGKTSLVEAMLFAAGAVTRMGKVDDGSTVTDFDPDEIKRKISINTSVAYCDYKGHRLNLVDTPGYGDLI